MTQISATAPLGDRIVWARKRSGISQERLAEHIGTSRRHMIRIEKGQHRPGQAFLDRIAEATGQPVELFAESEALDADDEEADAAMRATFALFGDLVNRLVEAKLREAKPA